MEFISPLFLIGAAAAAIPLVIHLIHTARAPQTPFPTVRFLRAAMEKTARRRHVQNLFLLVLRMLLFALLAVALARPILSRDVAAAGALNGRAAIIIDNSMSSSAAHGGRTRLERLKAEAEALLAGPLRPAEALLLVADGPASREPPAMLRDRDELIQRLRKLEAGAGRADLAALIAAAHKELTESRAANPSIYVFTDLQAESWAADSQLKTALAGSTVPISVIFADDPDVSNAAVTDLRVAAPACVVGFPLPLEARLWSTPDLRGQRYLSLYVDDMERPRERLAVLMPIEAGKNDRAAFQPVLTAPGRHRLRVELEAEDNLPLDNARRLAVDVAAGIRVLLVRDPRGPQGADDPLYYLERAFAAPGPASGATWAVEPQTLSPAELSAAHLAEAHAVVMADVEAMTAELRASLKVFVQGGGTLVVFPGPHTAPELWNEPAGGQTPGGAGLRLGEAGLRPGGAGPLLPARIGSLKEAGGPNQQPARDAIRASGPAKVAEVAAASDVLAGLADLKYYQPLVVSRYLALQPDAPGTGPDGRARTGDGRAQAEVLWKLNTGDALLVAGRLGRGRVYLFAVPASGDWSNLQRTNIFLPFMLRLAHRAARRVDWPLETASGQPVTLDYWPDAAEALDVLVTDPEHAAAPRRVRTEAGTGYNALHLSDTWALGFYEVEPQAAARSAPVARGGPQAWTLAVNPDGRESNLSPLTPEGLRRKLPAREVYLATSIAELERELKSAGRRELWQTFLLLVLALTVLECLISNRLRPKGQVGGVKTLVDRLVSRGPKAVDEGGRDE